MAKKSELPWPQKGDNPISLVMKPLNSFRAARNRWVVYAESYRHVADATVKRHLRTQEYGQLVMYPVAFMYRHYIELQLKNIIRFGHLLHARKLKVPAHHRLGPLWQDAKRALNEVWPSGDVATLDAAEASIKAFESLDPNSVVFRYAEDVSGNEHLADVDALDFKQLYRVMNNLGTFFESCIGAMDMYFSDMMDNYSSYS